MSSHLSSRDHQTREITLADAILALPEAGLPVRRRQEIASALRTLARALDRPPERIPAEPRHLSARLKEIAPRAIGISPRRWNNIRSLIRAGLAVVLPMSPGRNTNALSPSWDALSSQLQSRWVTTSLGRFMRFCSKAGTEPLAVGEATFAEFRTHLDNTLVKDPDAVFRKMVLAWRSAQHAVADWPRVEVTVLDRRKRWTLPWSTFPRSLKQDCDAWLNRLSGRDPLEAPIRPVRASTVERREWQIRSFASALVLRGRAPETLTSLADLVEIENFKEGLRFFLDRSGEKRTAFIRELACILTAIARHHLEFDKVQLDPMAVINRRLDIDRGGLTEKNRARLRQFDDPDNVAALLGLPKKLMRIAARNRNPRAGALQAQTATAIEILLMAPIRIGNLSDLDLDRDLVRPGRGKQLHIVLAAEQVKGREPLEYPLPASSVELIERYLEKFRPRFAHPRCTALFPGKGGGAKASSTMRKQISDTVHSYTGIRMNPHLFRHAISKIFLDQNPGQHEVVRRVLAHKSIDTTTSYYTGLETAAAVRYFDATILKLRNEGKDKVR
jgi:integrase